MPRLLFILLVLGTLAGLLGFTEIAGSAFALAKLVFILVVGLCALIVIFSLMGASHQAGER